MDQRFSASYCLRTDLARALGFPNYPHDAAAEPYLNYLMNRCIGEGTTDAHIELLITVVRYFEGAQSGSPAKRSVQGLLDVISASAAYAQRNREDIEDIVLYVIGTWALFLSSFVHLPMAGGLSKVMATYNLRSHGSPCGRQPYGDDLAGLIVGSGLLPAPNQYLPPDPIVYEQKSSQTARPLSPFQLSPASSSTNQVDVGGSTSTYTDEYLRRRVSLGFLHDLDSLESLTINAARLNAYTLNVFGAVDIAWTHNVSRHLLL